MTKAQRTRIAGNWDSHRFKVQDSVRDSPVEAELALGECEQIIKLRQDRVRGLVDRRNAGELAQAGDFDDVGDDFAARVGVETGCWLVEEENRGDGEQFHGDVDALALAGGETADEGATDAAVFAVNQTHNLQHVIDLFERRENEFGSIAVDKGIEGRRNHSLEHREQAGSNPLADGEQPRTAASHSKCTRR